jgi:tRNA (cmo5U34)-methyltransferase
MQEHISLSSLKHTPGDHWEFDESVAAVFDDMLARSIPQIEDMRSMVFDVVSCFIQPGTYVVDLGCSLGGAMAALLDRFGPENRFLGVEASIPMVEACRKRFKGSIENGIVEIRNEDLRHYYPNVLASVTLSILTLMFVPIEHRFRVVREAFEHTLPGGGLILVEKVLAANANMNAFLDGLYHLHKRRMGYSDDSITRKSLALEGVLVPLTASWNEQMLNNAGFQRVECFWRSLNFSGWIALKS